MTIPSTTLSPFDNGNKHRGKKKKKPLKIDGVDR
jgi:hypothetical protein